MEDFAVIEAGPAVREGAAHGFCIRAFCGQCHSATMIDIFKGKASRHGQG